MHSFQETTTELFEVNPFKKIGNDWMLVTAGTEEKANTMTASWGGLGQMWGKDVVFVVIRGSRYTKEFMDAQGKFSISFPREKYRKEMRFLGQVSGRDEDKIKESGVTIDFEDGIPFIDQANEVLLCRTMSTTLVKPEDFLDGEIDQKWYGDKDYHTLYIAEITKVLAR